MLLEDLVRKIELARSNGRSVTLDPPISREQLAALEARCRGAVPLEIRNLLGYTAGFSVDDFSLDLSGNQTFGYEYIFPRGVPIAPDGFGNFWVVDVRSDGAWGPILFVSHDPPVVVVQAPELATMIDQALTQADMVDFVAPFVDQTWDMNPYAMSHSMALASTDEVVRTLAESLGEDFVISDLRSPGIGAGFVWGTAGPNMEIRRAGDQLVFATKLKAPGPLHRLLSRFLRRYGY